MRLELKSKVDKSTATVGNIITVMMLLNNWLSKQKIDMNGIDLKNTINQLDLINVWKLFIPKEQNTHFSQASIKHLPENGKHTLIIELGSPALQADALPSELPGKPFHIWSPSKLPPCSQRGIFCVAVR